MRTLSLVTTSCLLLAGRMSAQARCLAVGTNRWAVKTMAPARSGARRFDAAAFARLPAPRDIEAKGGRKQDVRYTAPIVGNLHEGDLVTVSGWVQFIKTSADDCDYHIQLTPTRDGRAGTVIVEIPEPDARHVTDPVLRAQLAAARTMLRQQLHIEDEPPTHGIRFRRPVPMEFTGALFFDGNTYPNCDQRGHGTPAVTCWEVHPVISSSVTREPAP